MRAGQRELERQRKHLQVVIGPLTDFGNGPAAAAGAAGAAASTSAAGGKGGAAGQGEAAGEPEGGAAHRFFQSEGEEMPAGFAESPTEPAEEPAVAAERLWREARPANPLACLAGVEGLARDGAFTLPSRVLQGCL